MPVKTSIVLAERLMEAGCDFDFAFADGATLAISETVILLTSPLHAC